ncbi:MAG: hypothetical protein KatS3mg076_3216 [Candidatus Binatia bacterium]|nr:MAG: hypothetical protein KatS3mg076_3216 [Candidatus Binatia bacterium]
MTAGVIAGDGHDRAWPSEMHETMRTVRGGTRSVASGGRG